MLGRYRGYRRAGFRQQYTQAFFWAVQVSTGIGKDIIPRTSLEVAFTTVIILWGMLMYASIIGAVSSAVAVLDATGIQRSRKLSAVKSFLVQQNVHKHLQLEIMNYYTYLLSLNTRDSQALSDLPVTLRIKLELSLKQESVDQVPLFHNLDAACILSIVHHLKNCVSLPSEILYAAGARVAQESEIPNFKGSALGHVPLVSADFWTSDHLSERSRSVDVFSVTRARGTLTLKRR